MPKKTILCCPKCGTEVQFDYRWPAKYCPECDMYLDADSLMWKDVQPD